MCEMLGKGVRSKDLRAETKASQVQQALRREQRETATVVPVEKVVVKMST
jgi:hypothetical protein